MKQTKGLNNITWEQVEEMIKDKEFLMDIKSISSENLVQKLKRFNIDSSSEEANEFKLKVIKVIDAYGQTQTRKLKKQILEEEDLNGIVGGGIGTNVLSFIAGVVAVCILMKIPYSDISAEVKEKYASFTAK